MFEKVEGIMKNCLFELLKKGGQTEIDTNISITELVKPSIFDTETIQELKQNMMDVQEDILECKQLDQIQPQLDQMRKEAEANAANGVDTNVPDGFGLPQKDAETFKKVEIKNRKRKIDEITNTAVDKNSSEESVENKHRKVMENQVTEN